MGYLTPNENLINPIDAALVIMQRVWTDSLTILNRLEIWYLDCFSAGVSARLRGVLWSRLLHLLLLGVGTEIDWNQNLHDKSKLEN